MRLLPRRVIHSVLATASCFAHTSNAHSLPETQLITSCEATRTPLWDRRSITTRITALVAAGQRESRPVLPITIVLGHWEATDSGASAALSELQRYKADLLFTGGDGIEADSQNDAPLVARAVLALSPRLHLAFQHVHHLKPQLLYHPNTVFLPHMAFDRENRAMHSGFEGPRESPRVLGALADQLQFIEELQQEFTVHPTFVFLGGGKTAAAELVALYHVKHKAIQQWCQLVVVKGIPAKSRPKELSLVEQETVALREERHGHWAVEDTGNQLIFSKQAQASCL